MSEIFYINSIPVKTNKLDTVKHHQHQVERMVKAGIFCGSFDGYW